MLYWTAYQQYNLTYYYYYYAGYTINMSDDMGDGSTVGESLFRFGLDTAASYAVGREKAKEMNVALSAENAAALADLYADNVTAYGEDRWESYLTAGLIKEEDFTDEEKAAWIQKHGEEFYQHSLMYYACTTEGYNKLINDYYYFSTLRDTLFGEDGEYEPTEATLDEAMKDYVSDNGVVWARCILFSTMECADEAAEAEVKAQADAAYAQLTGLSGQELSDKFTELQSQFDTSGYAAGEVQKYTNTDSLVDGYYEGIVALQPGQIGMTGKTDYGYFILLREEDDTDSLTQTVTDSYITSTYDALIDQWAQDYGVECAMPDLDLNAFYTKLAELQTILMEVDTVPTSETGSADGSAAQ